MRLYFRKLEQFCTNYLKPVCMTFFRYLGQFAGMLLLIAKRDLPRLLVLFLITIFSFGTSLYFALVGHRNDGNIDEMNNNVTRQGS